MTETLVSGQTLEFLIFIGLAPSTSAMQILDWKVSTKVENVINTLSHRVFLKLIHESDLGKIRFGAFFFGDSLFAFALAHHVSSFT